MANGRLNRFREFLHCPSCFGPLVDEESALRCSQCSSLYAISKGCPVLLSQSSDHNLEQVLDTGDGQKMVHEYEASGEPEAQGWLHRFVDLLRPPPIMYRYNEDLNQSHASVLFTRNGTPQLALNVGGGPVRENRDEITMNLRPFYNVDLVGDAHNIPVSDNSFDSVLSMAVLEHVADPQQVVAEMIRVLKPGGYLYAEIPFIFFFHGYPTDYTRFTLEGMKLLFSDLEDADFGMTHGPVSAALQSNNMVLQLLIPQRMKILRKLVNGAFRWLFFPFKYLDIPLRKHPDAHILSGGFYVLGRKPEAEGVAGA